VIRCDSKQLWGTLEMVAQIGAPTAAARAHEELFAYWMSRKRAGRLPGRADLNPGDIKRLLPTISLMDVFHDPLDFRVRLAGTRLWDVYGREITGRRLGEIYSASAAEEWRFELAKVVRQGKPAVGVHNLAWRGAAHLSLLWLRLPLASNGKDVDMVLGYDAVIGLGQVTSGVRAA
jgi:hypothetical protein